jgi:hypothetical protein
VSAGYTGACISGEYGSLPGWLTSRECRRNGEVSCDSHENRETGE